MKTLAFEKETLGFHVSGHPLDLIEDRLTRFCSHDIRTAREQPDKTAVRLGGAIGRTWARLGLPRTAIAGTNHAIAFP